MARSDHSILVILVSRRAFVIAACAVLAAAACGTTSSDLGTRDHPAASGIENPVKTVPRSTGTPSSAGQPGNLQPPPLVRSERRAPANSLAPARRTAARFFFTYVPFLYGHLRAGHVLGLAPQLRSQLGHAATLVTPAERSARPHVVRIKVESAGPPVSATAIATVLVHDRRYQLTATLEPRHGGWEVIAVG